MSTLQRVRIIGVPGSGKTTRAIEIVEKVCQRGVDLMQVGFSTFTRAARREASERAAATFGVKVEDLERHGWFRTIHSSVMKLLGVPRGAIVDYDPAWLAEVFQEDVKVESDEDGDGWASGWKGKSPSAVALALWDVARNRLLPFRQVYDEAVYRMGWVSGLDSTADGEAVVERYERAKARHVRLDFTDCVLRYAGYRMTVDGPEPVDPDGAIPPVVAWVFDEAQDTSPLLDAAARRLASASPWWYLMGDRDQEIYGWAGASGDMFMRWDVVHQEHLLKTWRCAKEVMELGQRLLTAGDPDLGGLRALAVEPRCPGGTVTVGHREDLLDHVDGRQKTLVLARTNQQANSLGAALSGAGVPWRSARGTQRWPPLASTRTCQAFADLDRLGSCDMPQWRRVVAAVPKEWLVRGTKERYKKADPLLDGKTVTLADLEDLGATEGLRENIAAGAWPGLVKEEERAAWEARARWGGLVDEPAVVVSTVHGSKGMEADKVVLLTGVYGPVLKNLQTPEGREEERRVWYVGATRARDHLVLLRDAKNNYTELLDQVL